MLSITLMLAKLETAGKKWNYITLLMLITLFILLIQAEIFCVNSNACIE